MSVSSLLYVSGSNRSSVTGSGHFGPTHFGLTVSRVRSVLGLQYPVRNWRFWIALTFEDYSLQRFRFSHFSVSKTIAFKALIKLSLNGDSYKHIICDLECLFKVIQGQSVEK